MKTIFQKRKKGYALYIAILTASALALLGFSITNMSLKQITLSYIGSESHIAFYNADTGLECALYWDLKNGGTSAFDINFPGSLNCNGQTISTGSQTVSTNPTQSSKIGGGGLSNPISIFQLNLPTGCAIVSVTKNPDGTTLFESRGYNSCSGIKRFERGIKILY